MLRDGEVQATLTAAEMLVAGQVGLMREVSARRKGSVPDFGFRNENEAWGHHIIGAMAEMAFAKAMGLYWGAGVDTYRVGDVGDVEVRWNNGGERWDPTTKRRVPFAPRLKIRAVDKPGRIVALVRGVAPLLIVAGWIKAEAGMRDDWLESPREGKPAYFVPLEHLWPMYSFVQGGAA